MIFFMEIQPSGPVDFETTVPGSKSYTNRALICAAIAPGISTIANASLSEDSMLLVEALRKAGIGVEVGSDMRVNGGGVPVAEGTFFLGNAGTSLRFLAGFLSRGKGTYRIDGNDRMRERPVRDLAAGLEQLGCRVTWAGSEGCPPFDLEARGMTGERVHVSGAVSSQYLSSLLLASPREDRAMEIEPEGAPVSRPYIDMTLQVMKAFGVGVVETEGRFTVPASGYRSAKFGVEPDAAAANYFFAMAAVTGGRVRVKGLSLESRQAEIRFLEVLRGMGCAVSSGKDWIEVRGGPLSGIDVDMNAFPDSVQTLAAIAPFASGPTRIRNVRNLRVKETDRIRALATELRRMGGRVEEEDDGLVVHPAELTGASVETYGDHRMAMSFAVTALRVPGVVIGDPDCVGKSFPGFFDHLAGVLRG